MAGKMMALNFTQLKVGTIVNIFTYCIGAVCILALSGHIPSGYPVILFGAMGLSVWLEFKKIVIPRWLLAILSVTVLFYYFLQFDMQDLIEEPVDTPSRNPFIGAHVRYPPAHQLSAADLSQQAGEGPVRFYGQCEARPCVGHTGG
jgi:hypothetical protein